MRYLLLLLVIISSTVQAQLRDQQALSDEERELESYMKSNYIQEYVPQKNERLEIKGNKRITLAYYAGLTPSDFASLSDYEFQFAYNLGTFWLESVIGQGKSQFGFVGTNSSATSAAQSEGNFRREDEIEESYLYLGLGASLRSRHLASLLGFDRVYETFSGYVTYHTMSEELREEDYAGFGTRADAAVNYLLSNSSHIGLRFSFGISSLKRAEAYEGETSSQRSLMFRWNKLGVDYSFYF